MFSLVLVLVRFLRPVDKYEAIAALHATPLSTRGQQSGSPLTTAVVHLSFWRRCASQFLLISCTLNCDSVSVSHCFVNQSADATGSRVTVMKTSWTVKSGCFTASSSSSVPISPAVTGINTKIFCRLFLHFFAKYKKSIWSCSLYHISSVKREKRLVRSRSTSLQSSTDCELVVSYPALLLFFFCHMRRERKTAINTRASLKRPSE